MKSHTEINIIIDKNIRCQYCNERITNKNNTHFASGFGYVFCDATLCVIKFLIMRWFGR